MAHRVGRVLAVTGVATIGLTVMCLSACSRRGGSEPDGSDDGRDDAGVDLGRDASADGGTDLPDGSAPEIDAAPEPLCSTGEDSVCYVGPAGTQGTGACIEGVSHCDELRHLGPCEGSIGPVDEVAGNFVDDDCNGLTDEGLIASQDPSIAPHSTGLWVAYEDVVGFEASMGGIPYTNYSSHIRLVETDLSGHRVRPPIGVANGPTTAEEFETHAKPVPFDPELVAAGGGLHLAYIVDYALTYARYDFEGNRLTSAAAVADAPCVVELGRFAVVTDAVVLPFRTCSPNAVAIAVFPFDGSEPTVRTVFASGGYGYVGVPSLVSTEEGLVAAYSRAGDGRPHPVDVVRMTSTWEIDVASLTTLPRDVDISDVALVRSGESGYTLLETLPEGSHRVLLLDDEFAVTELASHASALWSFRGTVSDAAGLAAVAFGGGTLAVLDIDGTASTEITVIDGPIHGEPYPDASLCNANGNRAVAFGWQPPGTDRTEIYLSFVTPEGLVGEALRVTPD